MHPIASKYRRGRAQKSRQEKYRPEMSVTFDAAIAVRKRMSVRVALKSDAEHKLALGSTVEKQVALAQSVRKPRIPMREQSQCAPWREYPRFLTGAYELQNATHFRTGGDDTGPRG